VRSVLALEASEPTEVEILAKWDGPT